MHFFDLLVVGVFLVRLTGSWRVPGSAVMIHWMWSSFCLWYRNLKAVIELFIEPHSGTPIWNFFHMMMIVVNGVLLGLTSNALPPCCVFDFMQALSFNFCVCAELFQGKRHTKIIIFHPCACAIDYLHVLCIWMTGRSQLKDMIPMRTPKLYLWPVKNIRCG